MLAGGALDPAIGRFGERVCSEACEEVWSYGYRMSIRSLIWFTFCASKPRPIDVVDVPSSLQVLLRLLFEADGG